MHETHKIVGERKKGEALRLVAIMMFTNYRASLHISRRYIAALITLRRR